MLDRVYLQVGVAQDPQDDGSEELVVFGERARTGIGATSIAPFLASSEKKKVVRAALCERVPHGVISLMVLNCDGAERRVGSMPDIYIYIYICTPGPQRRTPAAMEVIRRWKFGN